MLDRRLFLASSLALIAAPAIVRASSLMPIKTFPVMETIYSNAPPGHPLYMEGAMTFVPTDDVAAAKHALALQRSAWDAMIASRVGPKIQITKLPSYPSLGAPYHD